MYLKYICLYTCTYIDGVVVKLSVSWSPLESLEVGVLASEHNTYLYLGMATTNLFDLLGDDDTEDPSLLIAAQQQKLAAATKKVPAQNPAKPASQAQAQPNKPAKLPSKPVPPSQAGELHSSPSFCYFV